MLVDQRLFVRGDGEKGKLTFFISTLFFNAHCFTSEINCSGNRPWTSSQDIYHPDPRHSPVAANTVFSTPDNGRRKRLKHV
jgi:hypothetical protein